MGDALNFYGIPWVKTHGYHKEPPRCGEENTGL